MVLRAGLVQPNLTHRETLCHEEAALLGKGFILKPLLHYAALASAERSMQALLECGADPRAVSDSDSTALHVLGAVWKGAASEKCLDLLLRTGLPVDVPGMEGWTALATALFSRNNGKAKALLARGASANPDMSGGTSANGSREGLLHLYCRPMAEAVALSGLRMNVEINGAPSAAMVKLLCQHGADLHSINEAGRTPLHCAAHSGYLGAVAALLSAGADPNARHILGLTPLHDAISEDKVDVVRALAPRSDIIRTHSNIGQNGLHLATGMGKLEVFMAVLACVADEDIDARSLHGFNSRGQPTPVYDQTALHIACSRGLVDIVKLLLKRGACRSVVDSVGDTPVTIAAATANLAVLVSLLGKNGKHAAECAVNTVSGKGVAALHHVSIASVMPDALQRDRAYKCAAVLLEAGADASLRCSSPRYPSYTAAQLAGMMSSQIPAHEPMIAMLERWQAGNGGAASADASTGVGCELCGEHQSVTTLKTCGKCFNARYCSSSCQKKECVLVGRLAFYPMLTSLSSSWPRHKTMCIARPEMPSMRSVPLEDIAASGKLGA